MLVGVPKEIKDNEFRVGMTPATVAELTHHGHSVLVETSAGLGSGLTDDEYRAAGAAMGVASPAVLFSDGNQRSSRTSERSPQPSVGFRRRGPRNA